MRWLDGITDSVNINLSKFCTPTTGDKVNPVLTEFHLAKLPVFFIHFHSLLYKLNVYFETPAISVRDLAGNRIKCR